ncbi:hypothetical protein [Candidatus Tisiphia endosymbiont of Ditula angustiorana]
MILYLFTLFYFHYILLVNEELVDEDQNQQVLGVSKPRSTAYIST